METLQHHFGCKVGLSDHTLGIGASIAAIALGATAIEKHLTLKRSDGGADGAFSMEPGEFAILVREGNCARQSIGIPEWSMQPSEKESRNLRRSLYVVQDVERGDEISPENLRAIRPGFGLNASYFESLVGKKFNQGVKIGTPMSLDFAD
jgi:N-acetylneuraminate synthase